MADKTVKMIEKAKNQSLTVSFVVGRVEGTNEMLGRMFRKQGEWRKARKLEGFWNLKAWKF